MQLRMLLKPTVLPFFRVRGVNGSQPRRGDLFSAKSQMRGRGAVSGKGRRFTA